MFFLYLLLLGLGCVDAKNVPFMRGKVHVNGVVVDFKPLSFIDSRTSTVIFSNGTNSTVYLEDDGRARQVLINGTDVNVVYHPNTSCSEAYHSDGRHLQYIDFTPGCYDGDSVRREYFMSIVTDISFFQGPGGNSVDGTMDAIAEMVSHSRLPFLVQMNVLLSIDNVYIATPGHDFGYPTNTKNTTCSSANIYSMFDGVDVLRSVNRWSTGTIHFLTACWSYGTVGLASVGRACANSYNVAVTSHTRSSFAWVTFAHEMGHAFGAWHSFENGSCNTGGIMDYCNRTFDGVIQFHPYKRPEMCKMLQYLDEGCPAHFRIAEQPKSCGDYVFQDEEECECMRNFGNTSCHGCVNCKLTNSSLECGDEFLVNPKSGEIKVYGPTYLPDPGCCVDGKYSDTTTRCGDGMCFNGKCTSLCKTFGLLSCPTTEFGCTQPCRYPEGSCVSTFRGSRTLRYISHLPNQTSCAHGASQCFAGTCLGFNSTTDSPTKKPTRKKRRTKIPTTSSPTVKPVVEYESYEAPTPPPTLRCGDQKQNDICEALTVRLSCAARPFCRWVKKGGDQYCQLRCSALSIE